MTVHEAGIGKYYEDFVIGDVYQHPFGRTVNETDNTWFTLLTLNTNQNHFNADFAARAPYGKIIVNSGLTVALVVGLSVIDMSQNAMFNLGWTDIKLPHPVFVGDTLYAESIVLDKRESKSRPYAGILTCKTRGLNQDGDEVVSWTRSAMVYKRSAKNDKGYFPKAKTGEMTLPEAEA
ncbi:MaoC family dehydratase [Actinocorallia aurea]